MNRYALTSFITFFLFALPWKGLQAVEDTYKCETNPPSIPSALQRTLPPKLNYMGKASDNRFVFYYPLTKTIYLFSENFSSRPSMFLWTRNTDQRVDRACAEFPILATCSWELIEQLGVESFMKSAHVTCNSSSFDSNSPNKTVLATTPSACLEWDKPFLDVQNRNSKCCEGLELNLNTMKCAEAAYTDPALPPCETNQSCAATLGCFPQRTTDLFIAETPENQSLRDAVSGQVDEAIEVAPIKSLGAECTHAKECASYYCVDSKCTTKNLCRLGDVGDFAPAPLLCTEGLNKDANHKCIAGPGHTPYVGMIDEFGFSSGGQCEFTLDDADRELAELSMKSIRAMEWVLSISTRDDSPPGDCFKLAKHLRENVAKPMIENRRIILQSYNERVINIEKDYDTLKAALEAYKNGSTDGPDVFVTMHGVNLTQEQIASRVASGYDSLVFMQRRNALFGDYEAAMKVISMEAHAVMFALTEAMQGWQDNDQLWSLGSGVVEPTFDCEAKYLKWDWDWSPGYETRRHNQIWKRWSVYYEVDPTKPDNRAILDREKLNLFLADVHNINEQDATTLYSRRHLLLDPLNFGAGATNALAWDKFGTNKDLNTDGLWGTVVNVLTSLAPTKQTRKARYLRETGMKSYSGIHNEFKNQIRYHYQSLRPATIDIPEDQFPPFVYEPELAKTEGKNCIENSDQATCESSLTEDGKVRTGFNQYMEELADHAFAQYLAYSYNDIDNYKNYFNNAEEGRLSLLGGYVVDLSNLINYYTTIAEKRTEQNRCIDLALANINGEGYKGVVDIGQSGGSGPGATVAGSRGGAGFVTTLADGTALQTAAMVPLTTNRFSVDLLKGASDRPFANATTGGASGGSNSGSGSGASLTDTNSAASAFAARQKKMKESNAKLAKKGINIAAKEANARKLAHNIKTGGASLTAASGGAASIGAGQTGPLGAMSFRAGIDIDAKNSGASTAGVGSGSPTGALNANSGRASAGAGSGAGAFSGFSGNSNLGGAATAGANSGSGKDPTGMSDEEKDVLMANYERNKNQYQVKEDDGLFRILSKAYVRNLNKVLTRKKIEGN